MSNVSLVSGQAPLPRSTSQSSVNDYFADQSDFWREIYGSGDVYALIHQERRAQMLAWVDELGLPRGSRVLDAGCGAGLAATALAQRGLRVHATDAVPDMVELQAPRC